MNELIETVIYISDGQLGSSADVLATTEGLEIDGVLALTWDWIDAARSALNRDDGILPMDSAPKEDGVKVDLWMEWDASPMTMGMGDSFRVNGCYRKNGKWVHIDSGKEKLLNEDYIVGWYESIDREATAAPKGLWESIAEELGTPIVSLEGKLPSRE